MSTTEDAQLVATMRRMAMAEADRRTWTADQVATVLPQLLDLADAIPRSGERGALEFPPFAGGPDSWKPEWARLARHLTTDG